MKSVINSSRHPRILITDFDGTITKFDFYERVIAEFGSCLPSDDWRRYLAGELTHFEALQKIFAVLPADEAEVMRIARSTELDPHFGETLQRLERNDWGVLVVSAGCQWYIDRLLRERGIRVPVISNPGELCPTGGLRLIAPTESPYFAAETGIDKAAVVRAAQHEYEQVAFAGNGRADLIAARLVVPEVRFATGWLSDQLTRAGEPFHPFEIWSDIAAQLID